MDINVSNEMIENLVREQVAKLVKKTIDTMNLESFIESCVTESIEEKYGWGHLAQGENLDSLVFKASEAETRSWLKNNFYPSDLRVVLKQAIGNKIQELTFEEVLEIAKQIVE